MTGNYSHRHRQNQTSGKSVCEPVPKSLFWAFSSAVYQDLSKGHDWPVKKAIADLPIRSKGNQTALQVIRWVRRGPRTRASPLFADVTKRATKTRTLFMETLDLKVVLIKRPNKGLTIKKQNILCISRKRTSCFTSLLIWEMNKEKVTEEWPLEQGMKACTRRTCRTLFE